MDLESSPAEMITFRTRVPDVRQRSKNGQLSESFVRQNSKSIRLNPLDPRQFQVLVLVGLIELDVLMHRTGDSMK